MQSDKYCIFYTDDDLDDQSFFRDAIADIKPDLDLYIQNDGLELMQQLDNPPPKPAILFLDLNMPRKNGLQVLKEIKESNRFPQLKVVIFTTSDDPSLIDTTRTLGADAFVTKPSYFNSFKQAISHCLSIDWGSYRPSENQFVLSFN